LPETFEGYFILIFKRLKKHSLAMTLWHSTRSLYGDISDLPDRTWRASDERSPTAKRLSRPFSTGFVKTRLGTDVRTQYSTGCGTSRSGIRAESSRSRRCNPRYRSQRGHPPPPVRQKSVSFRWLASCLQPRRAGYYDLPQPRLQWVEALRSSYWAPKFFIERIN